MPKRKRIKIDIEVKYKTHDMFQEILKVYNDYPERAIIREIFDLGVFEFYELLVGDGKIVEDETN